MKISYLWLKEFVDFSNSPEELSALLRSLGFETVSIERAGERLKGVVTAQVKGKEKHPNADRLSVCTVFDGRELLTVVCGAPNVAAGQTVALARAGALLPGGLKIERATIRGQESEGMICSAKELGLGGDHAGILVLPEGTPLGEDASDVLMLGDAVLDLEVTPNRADALSHWGMARDVAAALGKPLHLPDMKIPKTKSVTHLVKIEVPKLCGRYVARVVEGVRVGPSPLWMRLRLERCGIRAINNLVDITNYALLELGHPLHVFDRDALAGGGVVVRRGRSGEKLLCLDGVERGVEESLVIADGAGAVALAGVMGGELTAVKDATRNILIESAHFEPSAVRRARRRLNMTTESSYRFERGTDTEVADWAGRRAARLVLSLAGGTLTAAQDARPRRAKPAALRLRPARIAAMLGFDVPAARVKKSLEKLGFECRASGKNWTVVPPLHRHDVREEADLAEEVARLVGYDRIPAKRRASTQAPEPLSASRRRAAQARNILVEAGFFEAVNDGLVSRAAWEKLNGGSAGTLALDNPLSSTGELLAPSLLPRLLANLQTNLRRGNKNVRLFESARTFRSVSPSAGRPAAPAETNAVALAATGQVHEEHWKHKARALDVWDVKGLVDNLLSGWGVGERRFGKEDLPVFLHPGESLRVYSGEKCLGFFGRLHPRHAAEWDLPTDTFLAEFDIDALGGAALRTPLFKGVPQHPALVRDFSLVFPEAVAWETVNSHLFAQSPWVESVELFDLFQGAALPPGHRSLSFRVHFRHPERTLTDAESAELQNKILTNLERVFQARLRT